MKSGAQEEKAKELFATLDKNKDGSLSAEELTEAMKLHGFAATDEKAKEILKEFDTDNSGSLDLAVRSFSSLIPLIFLRIFTENLKNCPMHN